MENNILNALRENFSLERLLAALAIIALTWILVRTLQSASRFLAERFTKHRLFISALYPVLRLLIWLAVIPAALFWVFNPPMNTILAVSASAGLALGLGAQDLVKNVIAGVLILFERPFRVGDMVGIGDHYGEVLDIGLRTVTMRNFDDSTVTFPNALVLTQAVVNSNSGALTEMVVVEFTLPAGFDVMEIRHLAWESAACSPYVFLRKPITVVMEDHFDRAFLTRVKIKSYVLDVRLERKLAGDITERFKRELQKRGDLNIGFLPVSP